MTASRIGFIGATIICGSKSIKNLLILLEGESLQFFNHPADHMFQPDTLIIDCSNCFLFLPGIDLGKYGAEISSKTSAISTPDVNKLNEILLQENNLPPEMDGANYRGMILLDSEYKRIERFIYHRLEFRFVNEVGIADLHERVQ